MAEYTEKQYIQYARQNLINHDDAKALMGYIEVLEQNENNPEASFWVLTTDWEKTFNELSAGDKMHYFTKMSNRLLELVEEIAKSEGSDEEKAFVLFVFACKYTPIVDYVARTPIAVPQKRIEAAVLSLYWTGNSIERHFEQKPDFMKVACKLWKEGVKLQRKFYAYSYNGNKAEDYAEKIKKIEPGYVMPKKSGCISLG